MEGCLVGVFGTDPSLKNAFESSIAKKSEVEGISIFHRSEGEKKFSFLDDATFPEKIQGYARIASLSDYAYYILPSGSKLAPPDGELAVLLDALGVKGTIVSMNSPPGINPQSAFKGLSLANYGVEERSSQSSIIDLSKNVKQREESISRALVYIDRAFNVKGVGLVVLGFVVSGTVSLHDKLRLVPGAHGKTAEVKGIQINDEDYDTAGRGIRVGLSLRNVELKDLEKTSWLDDGSFQISNKITFDFKQSPYYRQGVTDRDLHLQCIGELLVAKIGEAGSGKLVANLSSEVPIWNGMRTCLIDLNAKQLRVCGGGAVHE